MIIFIKQTKSIKTEDNFQKKKSIYNTKTFETTKSLSKKTTIINKVKSHLEQNSDQTFYCKFKKVQNTNNKATNLVSQL